MIQAYRASRGRDESERLDQALAKIGRVAVPRLITLLNDPELSAVATWGLGVIADRRAVEPLIEVARSAPHPEVRSSATKALGRLADPRAFDVLIQGLDDDATRLVAIEGLIRLRHKRAIPALQRYADDPRVGMRSTCVPRCRASSRSD